MNRLPISLLQREYSWDLVGKIGVTHRPSVLGLDLTPKKPGAHLQTRMDPDERGQPFPRDGTDKILPDLPSSSALSSVTSLVDINGLMVLSQFP